jgi:pantoate--beta-alanine ligase
VHIVTTTDAVRAVRWADPGATWGLVPTMGALHEGHLSLVRRAREENDRVGVSIFVNPAQFGPAEDLDAYPRALARDCEMLESEGADLVWTPAEAIVYPPGYQTYVTVEEVAKPLEGAARPGHFRGVATIVAKLFNVFQPTRAYFGQKDAQQVAVIKRMTEDLAFNLTIVVCPTVREPDGLAMSSRNAYLTPEERTAAAVLYRALTAARDRWGGGERDGEALRQTMRRIIEAEPLACLAYVSAANPETLAEIEGRAEGSVLLSMAVYMGSTRLIDNVVLSP